MIITPGISTLDDAVFNRVDADAELPQPLDAAVQVFARTVELKHGPGDLGRNVCTPHVGNKVKALADLVDNGLFDLLGREGELHSQPGHVPTSKRSAGKSFAGVV